MLRGSALVQTTERTHGHLYNLLFNHSAIQWWNKALHNASCSTHSKCVEGSQTETNNVLSVLFSCHLIYWSSPSDINECLQGSHNCGFGFECVNTMGSFRCNPKPRCPAGYNQDAEGNCAGKRHHFLHEMIIWLCAAALFAAFPQYWCVHSKWLHPVSPLKM